MTELAVNRGVWLVPRLSAYEGATSCSVSLENPPAAYEVSLKFFGLSVLYYVRLGTFVVMIDYLRPSSALVSCRFTGLS